MIYTTEGFTDEEPSSCFWGLIVVLLIAFGALGLAHFAASKTVQDQAPACLLTDSRNGG